MKRLSQPRTSSIYIMIRIEQNMVLITIRMGEGQTTKCIGSLLRFVIKYKLTMRAAAAVNVANCSSKIQKAIDKYKVMAALRLDLCPSRKI